MNCKQITAILLALSTAGTACPLPASAEDGADTKLIALTFDDGPNTHTTPQVLDVLEQYDARASFFLIGDKISEDNAYVVQRAYDMGCEINSHSRTHSDMTELTAEEIRAEMEFTADAVYGIVGEYPKFFRPPYLNVNQTMYDHIDIPFITGFSSGDSGSDKTAADVADSVLTQAKDGAIILMHDFWGNDKTVEALGTILPELEAQGYEFVTLTELFERKGETPEHGVVYREVMEHPCNGYVFSQTLYSGYASGDSSWEGWSSEIRLDGKMLAEQGDFVIEVAYEGVYPPVFILNRWVSSEDHFWEKLQPAYYDGKKACFRSEDMQAVLDSYGVGFADVNKILIQSPWSELTVTQADLLVKTQAVPGDADLDGRCTVSDIIAVQKFLLAAEDAALPCWENADLCQDGRLDGFDLCAMKQYLLTGGNAV
ncbi:MAG: polysaccharide deacetylase family protein [Oscillospiraceae bacterium]|nr:polysaccharide deacetylase family protein [Oscillospiraceae bacterium]